MLLPQRPLYPDRALARRHRLSILATEVIGDEELRAALVAAGLRASADRLDETRKLASYALSRVGNSRPPRRRARADRPSRDWLFLDEATSALDEASEAADLPGESARELPTQTTDVVDRLASRATLAAFHTPWI